MVAENYKIFSTKIVFFLLLTFYDARTPFPCVQQNVHLFYTVCKAHYINCVLKEPGFNSTCGNPTFTHSILSKKKIIQNHKSDSFYIPNEQNEFDLSYLYWIPKIYKNLYKDI